MEQKIYSTAGKEVGSVKLPEGIFDAKWNGDLVHQVVTSMQSNARQGNAHTKDRSEVRGGGKKPWRQKGTGRARHGSRRSPIWVGGGVTFGPRNEKDYSKKVNKKMRNKALVTILSQKLRDGEIVFVDDFSFDEPKASQAKEVLAKVAKASGEEMLSDKKRNAAYITTDEHDLNTYRSFANFGNVKVDEFRNLNPIDMLRYKYLVIENPQEAITQLEARIN
jgi:large subunit ribosomal protein L4